MIITALEVALLVIVLIGVAIPVLFWLLPSIDYNKEA